MLLKDIRAKGRDLGVKNYSRMVKTDLIRAIQEKEISDGNCRSGGA